MFPTCIVHHIGLPAELLCKDQAQPHHQPAPHVVLAGAQEVAGSLALQPLLSLDLGDFPLGHHAAHTVDPL